MVSKHTWPTVAFGDVVRQVKDRVDPATSGLTRYIAGEHMETDDLRLRRWGEINGDYLGPAFHMRFKPGQVLYGSRRTYLRKVAVADFEGICANTTFVLEPKDPDVLLPELLPFIMQTESFHEHSIKQSKGSVNPYINFSDLAWYEFPLPPPDEQRRLASVLWAVEKGIASTQNLLQKTDVIRKATLIDIFSQLYGKTDVEWVPVTEVGHVLMGRQRAPQYDKGVSPRPYLRVANVFDGYIDTSDVKEMDFSSAEFEQYKLLPGDVLLNEGQSRELVGRSAIFSDEIKDCCFQNTLVRFRPISVASKYAQRYFQFCLYTGRFIAVSKQTTSIAHLGVNRFAKMKFPLVSKGRENEIVDTFDVFDRNLRALSNRAKHIQRLKQIIFEYELTQPGELNYSCKVS